jgi:hypothetical protein
MVTRKARKPSDNVNEARGNVKGLRRAVDEATHATMKRLGQIALARGLSQEGLAKGLRERFNLSEKTNGANVYAHFTSPNPRRETIERYARLLDLNDEQLYVIEHGAVPADRESAWEHELFRMLEIFKVEFEPGTASAIADALRNPVTRERVFAAMASPRTGWPLTKWSSIPPFFEPAAEALLPDLDMRVLVRKQTVHTNGLLAIYAVADDLYQNHEKAHAFVDACAAIFRLDGFDTEPMYDVLRDWHEARAAATAPGAQIMRTAV